MNHNKEEGSIKIVFKLHDNQKYMDPEPAGEMVSKVLEEVFLKYLF